MIDIPKKRKPSKRLRNFCDNFILNLETKGNAEKSAVEAGYSERYARGNAYKLVAKGGSYLRELEDKEMDRLRNTKDDKLLQLSLHMDFIKSVLKDKQIDFEKEKDKVLKHDLLGQIKGLIGSHRVLMVEHSALNGDLVQKVDFKDVTVRSKEETKELKEINNRVFDVSSLTSVN